MMDSYNTLLISGAVFSLYCFTYFLVRAGHLKLLTYRRFWNTILLVSFLAMGCFGLTVAVLVDQKVMIDGYETLLWYHVEFGIIMTLVSLFHVLWHVNYYTAAFKKFRR